MTNKKSFSFLKVLMLIIGLVLIASPIFTSADKSSVAYADDDDFVRVQTVSTESAHFDIIVHEDGVLTVTMDSSIKILVSGQSEIMFYMPYSGVFYRELEANKVKSTPYVARYSNYSLVSSTGLGEHLNFYVDEDGAAGFVAFGIKKPIGYYQVGSTNNYSLKFDIDMRNTGTDSFDEVYYNLFDSINFFAVKNITFEITFPKDIDFSEFKPKFYYGPAGSVNEINESNIQIIGNRKIRSVNAINLGKEEALTFRQVLPKGYLNVKARSNGWTIAYLIIAVCLAGVALAIKLIFGQRREVVAPVEVTAPDGISPDIAEFYFKHKLTTKTVGALIIYFANKGYLKVELDKNNEPTYLIKIKDFPEAEDRRLAKFFNGIFNASNEIDIKDLSDSSFYNKFVALQCARESSEHEKLFDEKSKKRMSLASGISILGLALSIPSFIFQGLNWLGFVPSIVWYYIVAVVFSSVGILISGSDKKGLAIFKVIWLIFISIIIFVSFGMTNIKAFDPYYIRLIGIVASIIIGVIKIKPKYANEAAKIRGRVLGLKNYINLAEKDRLEMFAKENPNYYFDILPYAYVLNESDAWINKFKDIVIVPPQWLVADNVTLFDFVFYTHMFSAFDRNINNSIRNAAMKTVSPSRFGGSGFSGGGSFGGGGFSGGGGGGVSIGSR